MTAKPITVILAAAMLLPMLTVDASAMRLRNDNPSAQINARIDAEFRFARKVGGYPDPITALIQLISNPVEARPKLISPVERDVRARWPLSK